VSDVSSDVDELRRLLGWVFARSRYGCFTAKRSERDAALSDINYWTEPYSDFWKSPSNEARDGRVWGGESP
jgi:hypothetical protein